MWANIKKLYEYQTLGEHKIQSENQIHGDAFFVTHAYFLGADKLYEKLKKALKANINEDAWEELYSTTSSF
ncbi:MAG: hypothetical protein HY934_08795 [Candidatus Firestonebacteria bacterium]|nr:hypothetical protein [Candidatus Firestonebacteria bacterium]